MRKIGIAYSLVPADRGAPDDGPDDRYEEFDRPETVEAIADAIRGAGHDVRLLGDGREFLEKMLADPPDFVFNIAEGQGVGRDREARVPAVCEMLGVPYSGSDPLTLAAALDKTVARRLVKSAGVRVPWAAVLGVDADPEGIEVMLGSFYPRVFPLILKPAHEGSSKGIRSGCLADDPKAARDGYERLVRDYGQAVLAERFIEGDEVTVGMIGNDLEVLGAMRISPKQGPGRFVYSLEVKRDWRRQVAYEAPALLNEAARRRLERAAIRAYSALGCRDLARIDFRLRGGVPYFIEANPLPGLAPVTSDLVILAEGYGIGHPELIRRILRAALQRVGLAAGAVK